MAQLLQIAQLGQKILRSKAKKVLKISSPAVQNLIDDMLVTLKEAEGVGIAAPQLFSPLQIFILASHPNNRYPNAPKMKPTAVINPIIVSTSKKTNKDWEGCLSIPGIRGLVPRANQIVVEYSDRKGRKCTKKFTNFVARIFQHEYDHLQGVVFLDRTDPADLVTEKEYQRLIKANSKP